MYNRRYPLICNHCAHVKGGGTSPVLTIFVLRYNILDNNLSVKFGQSHFLGIITITLGSKYALLSGVRTKDLMIESLML